MNPDTIEVPPVIAAVTGLSLQQLLFIRYLHELGHIPLVPLDNPVTTLRSLRAKGLAVKPSEGEPWKLTDGGRAVALLMQREATNR